MSMVEVTSRVKTETRNVQCAIHQCLRPRLQLRLVELGNGNDKV